VVGTSELKRGEIHVANKTVGQRLSAARKDRGMTLNEVQQLSKVQSRYLQAIEIDDYDALPSDFYAKAFIRQYAQAVGEDGEKLVKLYMGEEDPYAVAEPVITQPTYAPVDDVPEEKKHRAGHRKRPLSDFIPYIILGLFAVAILAIVGYVMYEHNSSKPMIDTQNSLTIDKLLDSSSAAEKASRKKAAAEKAASESKAKETETSISFEEAKKKAEKEAKAKKAAALPKVVVGVRDASNRIPVTVTNIKFPLKLTINANKSQNIWAQVVANGSSVFMQTVQSGDKQTVKITKEQLALLPEGQKSFSYALGGAQYGTIKLNGKAIKMDESITGPVTVIVTMPNLK
jgi:cytoskeletal protein RodZ